MARQALWLTLLLAALQAVGADERAPHETVESLVAGAATPPALVGALVAEVAPGELARALQARRELAPPVLRSLGLALSGPEGEAAGTYLVASARALGRALGRRGPPWTGEEVELLATVTLVDPARFADEPDFRRRVAAGLPQALDPAVPAALRDLLLRDLNGVRGFDFELSEAVEVAWGAAPRASAGRRLAWDSGRFRPPPDPWAPIAASVYSLPARTFDAGEAGRFLEAATDLAPGRDLVVLTDLPEEELRRRAPRARLLETYGRAYTPWPRDPWLLVRDGSRVVVVERPGVQPRRETDAAMGRELVQNLPPALDRAWGEPGWTTSPVPFHNGQILPTESAVWLSLHTLEPRILELLGLERVPVASFATEEGIDRYLAAARAAAAELGELYGRQARFVHALPTTGPPVERTAAMQRLGGGAGFDLDSLLTLLPGSAAFVADVGAGRDLLATLSPAELEGLRHAYRLGPAAELAPLLDRYQESPRGRGLQAFLDAVADHLESEGLTVRRLPHLLVPTTLLDEEALDHPDFQLGWNNAVVEQTSQGPRAEAFAVVPPGDARTRRLFAEAGVRLDLLPPLVPSIHRNGGYRCASNHLRRHRTPSPLEPTGLHAVPQ